MECKTSLKKKKLPKYALANDLYVGELPKELTGLKNLIFQSFHLAF